MKKSTYTYKNKIPKELKKKKLLTEKKIKWKKSDFGEQKLKLQQAQKQTSDYYHERGMFSKLYKRKSTFPKKASSIRKLPIVLFVFSLIIIILIIPTLIVVPFVKTNEHHGTTYELTPDLEIDKKESPFSVAVKRVNAQTVDNVPLETYVARVVASEMPTNFEMEALKAQGLAARTYIVSHLLYQMNSDDPVTDTVQHQVYKDEEELRKQWGNEYNEKMNRLIEAVHATKGEIITYNDVPITPAFFSTSNGFTENSEDYWENELPYLRSVQSPWDKDSPKFLDQKTFSIGEIEAALQIDLPEQTALSIEITRTDSERVKELKLQGHAFSGRDVREKLQLQSSDFKIKQNNNHLIFTTKGYGHGIGMSQYGANGMAKEGKNYKEIIHYYYQDVKISNVSEVAPTLVAK